MFMLLCESQNEAAELAELKRHGFALTSVLAAWRDGAGRGLNYSALYATDGARRHPRYPEAVESLAPETLAGFSLPPGVVLVTGSPAT